MSSFGSNQGFVDELYARYLEDPASVSESWQEFFADYQRGGHAEAQGVSHEDETHPEASPPPPHHAGAVEAATPSAPPPTAGAPDGSAAEPLRGIAGKIAENMVQSLSVPTATSVRTLPVKLLEENRRVINQHQAAVYGTKVSFTHLIAWAVVRALEQHPGMNAAFVSKDGAPHRIPRPKVNLGLAIDMEKRGERVLLVPCIKDATALDFSAFLAAYSDLVARARQNKLRVEDFQDVTVTLTNPGMLGTIMSVPRLMAGQGTIIGAGNIAFPAEYTGMSPDVITELGLSKVMTLTSTYDHRIIQGAESGSFLATVETLLMGKDGFYDGLFADLGVPYEPVPWAGDQNPLFGSGTAGNLEAIQKQAHVLQIIRAFRVRGHLWAHLDPLNVSQPEPSPELELSHYGLSVWDLDRRFMSGGLGGVQGPLPLREILDTLRETYCRHTGVEYMHIAVSKERVWLQQRMEKTRNNVPLSKDLQLRILSKLNAAEALERFLHTTYTGHKRFSLEGAETLIPMLDALLSDATGVGMVEAIIGMAHRGRLNVLANTIGKSYGTIFREFEGAMDPSSAHGSGDVKYHLGARGTHVAPDGKQMALIMASNPSHLEAVNPVVEGMSRARQDLLGDTDRKTVLPILIHGDAAFAGQGVVAEVLNLSELKGYRTGGTIHIVVNNQIGFTTGPADARSSHYATDVAKMVRAPIFHVNGDHPEDAVRVIQLALAFRQEFRRDVVVDLICYRRWGHNETDDPSYTQPVLYAKIEKQRSVRKLYTESLLMRGDIDMATAEKALDDFRAQLEHVHEEVRKAQAEPPPEVKPDRESIEGEAPALRPDTHISAETIDFILTGLDKTPEGYETHPKLAKQLSRRRERVETGKVDWALGEALAFGSLV
ncbi:MAG TPA: multifunctional oxoglutarate decarboxylase/oxoglutarate dehydrogenase thiamine pyrophosphate-binding subunit/dihydrolipoyllysine-residue succinyltransferase subunit, partial [Myxococcota bacterium]|nr:multifunctional oxoglutarate decarboxylase/oxoglutarate dehydrogenase thiamine pyrophosphate-binding subunit/dihydrolipoyllysine-residue succinyltransferase subunit [Myxococcota bacterium]